MKIYANGKNISVFPFANLFTRGEKFSDTITFVLERFYGGNDLGNCNFLMRGINENGEEAQQILYPETDDNTITLNWSVSDYFTAVSGKLELELRAVRETDSETEIVVKYIMTPICVRESPIGGNVPLPDTEEQVLNDIATAVSNGLTEIQELIDSFDITEVEARLDNMEHDVSIFLARPEVIPVTQSQYNSIAHKENALYVIVEEENK